eukprot:GSChrysophyteH1.ASY1.ANO1.1981.1 assembled CDS
MKSYLLLTIFSLILSAVSASVIHIKDEKDFKSEVLSFGGVAIVEFYAPWCGHCKNLEPEYKKAASILNGVVKVVAVDATVHGSLAQKYGVQGYPTLKLFGLDKKKPTDYQGERKSDAILQMLSSKIEKRVRKVLRPEAPHLNPTPRAHHHVSDVITLTDDNFQSEVMDSEDHWLVEFYAPWCGHCKNLAPEWEEAAHKLAGEVKLGAIDATANEGLAQKYGIKGFPTIKLFSAGKKGKAKDYQGPRDAEGITQYALKTLDEAGVPVKTPQIVGKANFESDCTSGKICVVLFTPHILDSSASDRNKLLETYQAIAKSMRGKPVTFVWSEAQAQVELENALEVNQNYPTVSILSAEKAVYATQRSSWSYKNAQSFLNGIISGTEKKSKFGSKGLPSVVSVKMWDGKDVELPFEEEFSLEELMGDD